MARQKINWLLILQGWAMLWVVIGHAPLNAKEVGNPGYVEALYSFAYSFHMALFILVSGYLFQMTRLSSHSHTYMSIIKDKLYRLGIPYMAFTFIAMVLKALFPGEMKRQTSMSVGEYMRAMVNPFDGPLNEMWFVLTILILFSFVPLWRLICKKRLYESVAFIAFLLLHFYHPSTNQFCVRQVCTQGIFFFSGILICKYNLINLGIKYKWWLIMLGAVLFMCAVPFSIKILLTIFAIIFSVGLACCLDEYFPRTFASFREYTYQIFLMGIFVQMGVVIVYHKIDTPYIFCYLVSILLGLYIPVLASKLCIKMNWKPLLLVIGLKKYKNENRISKL